MNEHGQAALVTLMIAIVFIIMALAFAPPIKQFIEEARGPTTATAVGLDCGNASISDGDKANCVAVDTLGPYFIGGIIFLGGAIAAAKVISG